MMLSDDVKRGRLICCSGGFPNFPFFDGRGGELNQRFVIDPIPKTVTPAHNEIVVPADSEYVRVCQVPLAHSCDGGIAVSGFTSPYPVLVCDVDRKEVINVCKGHAQEVWGLSCLPLSSFDSNGPLIVSGDLGGNVLVFDGMTGSRICALEPSPKYACNILNVPEWNKNEVFVASQPTVHYDVEKQQRLGTFDGHSYGVWGLCASVSRNLLFTASADETVRVWSKNDYSTQHVLRIAETGSACYHADDKNLLFVGLFRSGGIEVWDSRKTDQRLKRMEIRSSSSAVYVYPFMDVRDFDRVDADTFVSATGEFLALWKPNAESGKELLCKKKAAKKGKCRGVCLLRPPSLVFGAPEDLSDRIEVILKTNRLNLEIVARNRKIVTSTALLLSQSPLQLPQFNLEDYFLPLSLDSRSLLTVLVGGRPQKDHLFDFFQLCRQLRLETLSSLMCQEVSAISELSVLVLLAQECWNDFELPMQQAENDEDVGFLSDCPNSIDLTVTTEEENHLSPFQTSVVLRLRTLKKKLLESDLLRELPQSLKVVVFAKTLILPPDEEEKVTAASEKDEETMTFDSHCLRLRGNLFASRAHSNVTLFTSDGGEERCHVEILVSASEFFYRMLNFEGKEFTSVKENGTIEIEDFSHSELTALLEWIYIRKVSCEEISHLLRLGEHGDMFGDELLIRCVCRRLSSLLKPKSEEEVMIMMMEYGGRIADLPEKVKISFMREISARLGPQISSSKFSAAALIFSKRNHDFICELLDRIEELEDEEGGKKGETVS